MADRLPALPTRPLVLALVAAVAAYGWWHWQQVAPAVDAETSARLRPGNR